MCVCAVTEFINLFVCAVTEFILAGRWEQLHLKNSKDGDTVVTSDLAVDDDWESGESKARFKIFQTFHCENCVQSTRGLIFRRLVSNHPEMKF